MPQVGNKLVNRPSVGTYQGKMHQRTSGLLKRESDDPTRVPNVNIEGKADDIRVTPDSIEIVDIDSLVPDPVNAREHPERNLESIRQSLRMYGQQKPIVARRDTRIVMAGNGTLEAAKAEGWTKIAVNFSDLTEVEGAGYGLADNRTSELARWNFSVVARLDKLMRDAGHCEAPVGWSQDELDVLRAADWTPPKAKDGDAHEGVESMTLKFDEMEWHVILDAIDRVNQSFAMSGRDSVKPSHAIAIALGLWLES